MKRREGRGELTSGEFLVELLPRTEQVRDLVVEVFCEDTLAEDGPLAEVFGGELAWERACRGDDEVFEDAARHALCVYSF